MYCAMYGVQVSNPYDRARNERAVREAALLQDARITGKVNQHHAELFKQKFPGNIEHCLRMSQERLQQGLRAGSLTSTEASEWAAAIHHLWLIYCEVK